MSAYARKWWKRCAGCGGLFPPNEIGKLLFVDALLCRECEVEVEEYAACIAKAAIKAGRFKRVKLGSVLANLGRG